MKLLSFKKKDVGNRLPEGPSLCWGYQQDSIWSCLNAVDQAIYKREKACCSYSFGHPHLPWSCCFTGCGQLQHIFFQYPGWDRSSSCSHRGSRHLLNTRMRRWVLQQMSVTYNFQKPKIRINQQKTFINYEWPLFCMLMAEILQMMFQKGLNQLDFL